MQLMRRRPREIVEPTINITPLIDVVFVILIAFIIIAPLLEKDQVQLAAGAHNETISDSSGPIQIHVRSDNSILLNGLITPLNELPERLFDTRKLYPDARPQVFHDKRALFGTYQTLKNMLEQAGFEEVDILLSPSGA